MYTLYSHFLGGNVFNTNKFYVTFKFFAKNGQNFIRIWAYTCLFK